MVKIWPSHEVYPLSTDQCLEWANCLLVSGDCITVIEKNILVRDKQWNVSTFLFGKLFREKGSEWARVYGDVMDDRKVSLHAAMAQKRQQWHTYCSLLLMGAGSGIQRSCPWSCASLCGQIGIERTFVINNPCHSREHLAHCGSGKTKGSLSFTDSGALFRKTNKGTTGCRTTKMDKRNKDRNPSIWHLW